MDHSVVDDLLRGAVDLHYHSGPSPFPRLMDVVEAARHYDEVGFKAVVMKSHHHSTVMEILALAPLLEPLSVEVYGGIALNGPVGGLNPWAVDVAVRMGGKIVWFPTMSSRAHLAYHEVHQDSPFPTPSVPLRPERELSVLDEAGRLRDEVYEIIELIKDTGAILSFGHMGIDQVWPVLRAAKEAGVERLILSHPDFVQQLSVEETKELAREGVTIEHCLGMYNDQSPRADVWPIERLTSWIQAIGVGRTVLGSDVGQRSNPSGVATYRRVLELLLEAGVGEADLEQMVSRNGAGLLGLD
jgi:hypothetical protein